MRGCCDASYPLRAKGSYAPLEGVRLPLDNARTRGYDCHTASTTKGLIIMELDLENLAYLGKVAELIKTDVTAIRPQLTTECPECDSTPERGDNLHITLNTTVAPYWAEQGEIDPLGMTRDDDPFILIGCEGYHLIQF